MWYSCKINYTLEILIFSKLVAADTLLRNGVGGKDNLAIHYSNNVRDSKTRPQYNSRTLKESV